LFDSVSIFLGRCSFAPGAMSATDWINDGHGRPGPNRRRNQAANLAGASNIKGPQVSTV
jgi:hypothetical protein